MEEEKKVEKVVPAYAKTGENTASKENGKGSKKGSNKKILIIILAAILIIGAIVGIVFLARVLKYSKYNEYSETIDKYGISELYDNGKSTSHDYVSKSEALKVILSSILNVKDISIVVHDEAYKNEDWVNYAVTEGIITDDDINESNASKGITFIEFVTYFANARIKLRGQELNTSIYPNFSDMQRATAEQRSVISDLIYYKVIENSNSKIDMNRTLAKGELNQLTTAIIEKYNIMIPEEKKFNVSEEKKPQNSDDYSFIAYGVDKSVYEKAFINENGQGFEKPYKVYAEYRDAYESIEYSVKEYFNTLLNVNFNNISVDEFMNKIEEHSLFPATLSTVREYVEYVKNNRIIISGSAEPQTPIIYYDGSNYRMRTKINFKIESADTRKELLYLDAANYDEEVSYDKDEYEFYVDVKIDTPGGLKVMYVWEESLYEMLNGEKVDGISTSEREVVNIDDID